MFDVTPRSPASARLLLELGVEHGLSSRVCLDGTDLSVRRLDDPTREIGAWQEHRLVQNVIRELGQDSGLPFEAAARYRVSTGGMLGLAVLTSATLRAGIGTWIRNQDLSPLLTAVREESDDDYCWIIVDAGHLPEDIQRFAIDLQIAFYWTTAGRLAGTPPCPVIELAYDAPGEPDPFVGLCGQEPIYSQPANRIGLANDYVDRPLAESDTATLRMCEREVYALRERRRASLGVTGSVRAFLDKLEDRVPSITETANRLGMSERTMRRRLRAEDVTYKQLVDDVRRSRSEAMLRGTTLGVGEISNRLGYGSSSAFVHAFHRWNHVPPGSFRREASRS